jgi:putative ABC transport system permease protein
MLLWQFSMPVLLANLVAWPAAYVAMSRWLDGFARRIDLEAWMFVGAAVATLAVAIATVLLHTWSIAGVRPVTALRHE